MPSAHAEALWNGGTDAYGFPPETRVSDGPGHPCRHCLGNIDAGETVLVLAYRPFPTPQPYAETGPIFRINISMDESLISATDRAASVFGESRSHFLAEAAKLRLGNGTT